MASQSDINAGRAVVGVALDDSTVEQQMRSVTARMKAAAAGLSAATVPVLAADVTGPAKKYEEAIKTVEAIHKTGMVSADQYEQQIKEIGQQYTANATPAQRLGVELANLDGQLRRGDVTADEYERQMTQLAAQFRATAGPVDQFEANLVALDHDLRTGAITQQQYKQGLIAAQTEFRNAATPAQQYDAEIRTLNAQLEQGRITQQQHTEAVQRAKNALADSEKAARSKGGALASLKTQVMSLATGYLSFQAILGTVGRALEYVRQEVEKAKQSQDALVDSRRRLAQVATSEEDLAGMIQRADAAAQQFGVAREKAYQTLFAARSEGFEADFERLMQVAPVVEPTSAAGVAGQIPGLFRGTESISSEQAISATLMAASASRLDFESLAKAMPQAAEGAAIAKASFAETAAALSVLAVQFKSGETAADRLKAFATKAGISQELAGQGIIGAWETLTAAGEEGQRDFLGDSNELNAAFTVLTEKMPLIKQRATEIQEELERIRSGGASMLERQLQIAVADPAEQARIKRTAEAIGLEKANEAQFAQSGSAAAAARDEALAAMKFAGRVGSRQFQASTAAATGMLFGASPERIRDLVARAYSDTDDFYKDLEAYRQHIREESERAAAARGTQQSDQAPGGAALASRDRPWENTAQQEARQRLTTATSRFAQQTDEYAKMFADEMKAGGESMKARIAADERLAEQTSGYADMFAAAMEAGGERTKRAIAEDKRRQRDHADQAGTFVGWRLGSQFGTNRTAEQQLDELRKIARNTDPTRETKSPEVYI